MSKEKDTKQNSLNGKDMEKVSGGAIVKKLRGGYIPGGVIPIPTRQYPM